MKIKRLKELIKNVSDNVYFMFGLNDKYEDKEKMEFFTLEENGESSSKINLFLH